MVAVRGEGGFDTLSIDVTDVANHALTNNTVVSFILATGLAVAEDPEVSGLALTLTVTKDAVDTAILV